MGKPYRGVRKRTRRFGLAPCGQISTLFSNRCIVNQDCCVFDASSDAIFVHDAASGRILAMNRQACELTGRARGELKGRTVDAISAPAAEFHAQAALSRIRSALTDGPQIFEWRLRRQECEFPVEVRLKPIDGPGGRRVLAAFRDVSDRQAAERRLVERERYYRTLIENAVDGIAIVSDEGRVRYVGPSITAVLGFSERQVLGRSVIPFLHPADAGEVRALLRGTGDGLRVGEVRRLSYRILHRDGRWRHHDAFVKDLRHDPAIGGFLVNFRDVTDLLRAENAARTQERQVEHLARLSTLGELAASLAHELNQPIAAVANYIGGSVERLSKRQGTLASVLHGLDRAQAEALRAGRIIAGLRSFTRRGDHQREETNLTHLVTEVAQLIELKAEMAAVDVIYDLRHELPPVACHRVLIEQVILNIAFNGIEAMDTDWHGDRRLTLSTAPAGDGARLSIADTGPGLGGINPDRLFEAFYTTKKHGLGIGLSLCRSIIDSHGGHVWVTAPTGQGTVFHVLLPSRLNPTMCCPPTTWPV